MRLNRGLHLAAGRKCGCLFKSVGRGTQSCRKCYYPYGSHHWWRRLIKPSRYISLKIIPCMLTGACRRRKRSIHAYLFVQVVLSLAAMFGSIWRTIRCVMSRVLLSRSRKRPRLFVCYSSLEETGGGVVHTAPHYIGGFGSRKVSQCRLFTCIRNCEEWMKYTGRTAANWHREHKMLVNATYFAFSS